MTDPLGEELKARLEAIDHAGLRRRLELPQGIDFTSNDYLAIANDPALREAVSDRLASDRGEPLGAPASRLLRGTTAQHLEIERRLAEYKGTEGALLFTSGYLANLAVLTTIVTPDDRVVSDAQNHASLIDAIRLSRATKTIVPHLDVDAIVRALEEPHAGGRTFLVTESLFSMDGDIAPLDLYAEIVESAGASLIVDDAHATGVYGSARGSGLVEHFGVEKRCAACISTLGKALGLSGAFVGGPEIVIDTLINCARSFIFTTAPSPIFLCAVEAALDLAASASERRVRVLARADRLRAALRSRGADCLQSAGPIVPVIAGENDAATRLAARVRESGFDVRAVRPPTVAPGTARLRVSVHADHSPEMIDGLADAIASALAAECTRGEPAHER